MKRAIGVLLLAMTLGLVGCGGGGDGGSDGGGGSGSGGGSSGASPTPPELTDTATQPSPSANTFPITFTRDASIDPSLADGVYVFQQVHVITIGGGTNDCPTTGTITCPSFSRLALNNQGKWIADSWAYMPITKKWVSLSTIANSSVSLRLGSADAYSAGNSWINGAPDFSKLTGQQNSGQWEWSFDGGAVYKLSASSTSLSGSNINSSPALGTYTGTASSIDLYFVQDSGQLFLSETGGSWGASSTDDPAMYVNLASFRQNHINKPYCLYNVIGSGYNVRFNPSSGANFTKHIGICSASNPTSIGSSAEGVTTVAGRKLILLSPVTEMLSSENSSVSQFLIGISLSNSGVAARGKVFQSGYIYTKKNMLNKAALIQIMKAIQPGDLEAQNIPNP
jgi:hypothetical protein